MAGWDQLQGLVEMELRQRTEEGCDTEGFAEKIERAGNNPSALMSVYYELAELPVRSDFPFTEPSGLDEIRKLRPDGPRRLTAALSESDWIDRFHGAWLGRSIGCALGKPLEYWPYMDGAFGNPGWKNVKLWYEGADAWPIRGYVPERSRAEQDIGLELCPWTSVSTRETIRYMETDDDIRYTIIGMLMLEQKGLDWDSYDVGKMWHTRLTYNQVCTAETHAYLNFSQVTSHINSGKPADWEHKKNWVRTYLNPYREWIGAQIRADGFAYGAAANPELAAELAWRDASLSHVKNGIYGEMFVAAMIAAAFVEKDVRRIVEIGLSEIPATSRLAADVRQAVRIASETTDQLELVDRIWEAFKHYHPGHTNNNAALVAAALLHGNGDFEKAVTTAVLGGWDTDCNGATVGSIMGAMLGASALPQSWTAPLNNMLYAEIPGFHPIAISECAERSFRAFKKLTAAEGA